LWAIPGFGAHSNNPDFATVPVNAPGRVA
jgi:hypothetical protein